MFRPTPCAQPSITDIPIFYPRSTIAPPPTQVQGFEAARVAFGRVDTYQGFTHCVKTILRKEGVTGFYKGMTGCFGRSRQT